MIRMFDVGGHVGRFDIFDIGETGSLASVQELTDRLVICDPGILVADRDRKKTRRIFSWFGRPEPFDENWSLERLGSNDSKFGVVPLEATLKVPFLPVTKGYVG
jgi:hypothetical protein